MAQITRMHENFSNRPRMSQSLMIPHTPGPATERIQAALDLARQGQVHLTLGPGEHLCGGLRLGSDTTLELAAGAVLRFLPDYTAYAETEVGIAAEGSDRAMITASGAARITLCGAGQIVCDGAQSYSSGDDAKMGTRIPVALRPRVLVFDGCQDVRLRDLTISDSPMWTLHFVDCDGLDISGLTIDNDRRMPNTDGLVIDSCRSVAITDCEIRTADDGIVLKTSARRDDRTPGVCRDVKVTHCLIESRSCALKIGTESFADFRNLRFEDCTIEGSNRALGIFSRDGGAVEDVVFHNISLECHETPDGFWGSGEPLTVTVLTRRTGAPAGPVKNVTASCLRGRAPGAINLWAERPGIISEVTLRDIKLQQAPGPLGSSFYFDLRPTPADLEPSDDAGGRVNAWRIGADGKVIGLTPYPGGQPAIFAHNVTGLHQDAVTIERPVPLPDAMSIQPVTRSGEV